MREEEGGRRRGGSRRRKGRYKVKDGGRGRRVRKERYVYC